MALETVSTIYDLVATNPTAGDPVSQADDHLRNIKTALLASFANTTGAQNSFQLGRLIVKTGGGTTSAGGTATVTYTTPFPAAVLFATAVLQVGAVGSTVLMSSSAGTVSGFPAYANTTAGTGVAVSFIWVALGY